MRLDSHCCVIVVLQFRNHLMLCFSRIFQMQDQHIYIISYSPDITKKNFWSCIFWMGNAPSMWKMRNRWIPINHTSIKNNTANNYLHMGPSSPSYLTMPSISPTTTLENKPTMLWQSIIKTIFHCMRGMLHPVLQHCVVCHLPGSHPSPWQCQRFWHKYYKELSILRFACCMFWCQVACPIH